MEELNIEEIMRDIHCVCCGDEFRTTEHQDICDKCFENILQNRR